MKPGSEAVMSTQVDLPESGSDPDAAPDEEPYSGSVKLDPLTRFAILAVSGIVVTAALDLSQMILAPVCLSVVVGMIFGPMADRITRLGLPSWVAAAAVVLLLLVLISSAGAAFVVPLSDWMDKLPVIWSQLQSQLMIWKGFFSSIGSLQEELRTAMGQDGAMQVSVDEASPVESVFYLAPAFLAQVILFLASLYFFVLTRPLLRYSALRLSSDAESRRCVAAALRLIEERLSSYLFSITLINLALGGAVALVLWALGVPSPLLWGMLAGALNYVVYIGPAVMVAVLTGVGLATGDTLLAIFMPPMAYLACNLVEAQFVTPTVLGRTMTLNPFAVFLAIAFWIWLWGPVGGFVAVPILLAASSVLEIMSDQDT